METMLRIKRLEIMISRRSNNALALHPVAQLELDDANLLLDIILVLPVLLGGHFSAGEGLLGGDPVAHTVVVTLGVVSMLSLGFIVLDESPSCAVTADMLVALSLS